MPTSPLPGQDTAYRRFVECIRQGAGLQDIYRDSGRGFAVAPAPHVVAARSERKVHARAQIELDRMAAHAIDLVRPLDRLFGLRGARVLEFGCGTGALAVALARQGARVVAVDPTASSLAAAAARRRLVQQRARATEAASTGGQQCVGWRGELHLVQITPCPRLPFDSGAFDLVVSNSVLEFIPEARAETICELMRLVAPGGHLVVSTENGLFPRDYYTHEWLPLLRRRAARARDLPYGSTWFELRRWVAASGATATDLSPHNLFNSVDKLIARCGETAPARAIAWLARLNRLYKALCRALGVPSDLLFPYTTFVVRVDRPPASASADPAERQVEHAPVVEPGASAGAEAPSWPTPPSADGVPADIGPVAA